MTNKHAEYLKQLEICLNRLDGNIANKDDIFLGEVVIAALNVDFENAKEGGKHE